LVEQVLHEESRPWYAKLKEKLKSPTVAGGMAGIVTSLLTNALTAPDMPWWLERLTVA